LKLNLPPVLKEQNLVNNFLKLDYTVLVFSISRIKNKYHNNLRYIMLCSVLAMVNILDILVGTGIHTCFYVHKNPKNVPPTKVLSLLLEVLFVDEKNNPKLRHRRHVYR
jgi:hypothetical protein